MRRHRIHAVAAHLKRHYRKYLVYIAIVALLHSAVNIMAFVLVVATLHMFRKHVIHHVKKHHRKLLVFLAVVTPLYVFGAVGFHPSNSASRSAVGSKVVLPAADPYRGHGIKDISPAGVDQGGVGDCFFESAVASEASSARGRNVLFHEITVNRDGTYTVTFRGDPANPVLVTEADLAGTRARGEVTDSSLWARILETAFLKYEHAEQYGTGIYSHQTEGIPWVAKIPSGGDVQALALVSGQSVDSDAMSTVSGDLLTIHFGYTTEANLREAIEAALTAEEPMTANAADASLSRLGFNNPGPLKSDHIYSVLGFNARTNIVVIRNPWGYNNAPFNVVEAYPNDPNYKPVDQITSLPDGALSMPLPTFMSLYSNLNFAGVSPAANDFANIGRDIAQGNFKYIIADSLYAASDFTDRGLTNVIVHTWRGMERLGHDLNPATW